MSKECVAAPGRINTTEEILEASGVNTWNVDPKPISLDANPVTVGRVAAVPFALNK
jgi:hypothetical protein